MVVTPARGSIVTRRGDPLFYWRDGWRFGAIEGEPRTSEQRHDDRDRDILAAIRKGSESKNAIWRAIGGNKEAALDRIDDLITRGHIGFQDGSRKLMLTATGARFLDAEA
jgi:predicted transcriptional regulator